MTLETPPLPAGRLAQNSSAPKRFASEALFAEGREVVIIHCGREYRLRVTRNGKLILNA